MKNRQYFRSQGIPLNSAPNSLSYDIVRFKIEVGVDAKFICENVTRNTQAPSQIGPPAAAILDSHSTWHSGGVNILELCKTGNLLFVLSAEERRAVLELL